MSPTNDFSLFLGIVFQHYIPRGYLWLIIPNQPTNWMTVPVQFKLGNWIFSFAGKLFSVVALSLWICDDDSLISRVLVTDSGQHRLTSSSKRYQFAKDKLGKKPFTDNEHTRPTLIYLNYFVVELSKRAKEYSKDAMNCFQGNNWIFLFSGRKIAR